MGLFCVNLHFAKTDQQTLAAALDRRGVTGYHIAPAQNGWTSLYQERASQQDDQWLRELAGGLSQDLNVPSVSFLVHDSDVACYWLFDGGRLLDHYNSCPDYFNADEDEEEDDESPAPSGGRPDVLLPYCRAGVGQKDLAAILAEETVFAESVIERLADALGIDVERALTDYRDVGEVSDEGDGSDEGDEPDILSLAQNRLADLLGAVPAGSAEPGAIALVQAAAEGDTDQIDRLLADGVAVDVEAAAPLPTGQPMAGLGQLFPGGAPQIAMTPLLAAIVNKQQRAAKQLLEQGADPNRAHSLFGPPVHVAAGAGNAESLQILLEGGADANARNSQGQTPLQVVAAARAAQEKLIQVEELMKSLGLKVPGLGGTSVEKLMAQAKLPTEGWDACERLLKAHGAH